MALACIAFHLLGIPKMRMHGACGKAAYICNTTTASRRKTTAITSSRGTHNAIKTAFMQSSPLGPLMQYRFARPLFNAGNVVAQQFELYPMPGTMKCIEASAAVDVHTDVVVVAAMAIPQPTIIQDASTQMFMPAKLGCANQTF